MKNLIMLVVVATISINSFSQQNENFWELLPLPGGTGRYNEIAQIIGDTLLVTSRDSAMHISYDNGNSWQKNSAFSKTETICITPDKKVFVSYNRSWLYYSLDTCKTWMQSSWFGSSAFKPSIYWDNEGGFGNEGRILLAGAGNVYSSWDLGTTWDIVYDWGDNVNTSIYPICRHPYTGDYFFGTRSYIYDLEGIWVSQSADSGTWEVFRQSNEFIFSMAFDSLGSIYIGTYSGLRKTEDYGQSWETLWIGGQVHDITILPNNDIFIAVDGGGNNGVHYRHHDSTEFMLINSGIQASSGIHKLSLINNYLYAICMSTPQVYRSRETVSNIGVGEQESNALTFTIYPNPINIGEILHIQLNGYPETGNLSLYSLMGEKVHGRKLETGCNNIEVDTKNFKSGVYLLKIEGRGEKCLEKLMIK